MWTELQETFSALRDRGMDTFGTVPFLVVLGLSLLCGIFLALLYRRFYASRETGSHIHRAFPLLSLAIAAIFVCIQFSLPLSLGLLGALSIVRFRTPIKEPEEIGFLMVVIATSLACATFNFNYLILILGLTVVALFLQELLPGLLRGGSGSGALLISLPEDEYEAKSERLFELLGESLPKGRMESVSQNDGQVVVAYSFRSLEPEAARSLQRELRSVTAASQINLSYDRLGGS